jgi:hypothetical protein
MRRLAIVLLAWGLANHAPADLSGGYEYSRHGALAFADDTTFAGTVARLSEEGGFFDSDNLVSNEATYLHVLGAMRKLGVSGGAYIGVGPDQNYSYIAQVRPTVAYLIDIRRDNLLQHLWFKALFTLAADRDEYLSLMLGRPLPADGRFDGQPVESVLAYLDTVPSSRPFVNANTKRITATIRSFGVPLTDVEYAAIASIHEAFIQSGLELRFTSHNRPARYFYPTLRDLIVERDLTGAQKNYLVRNDDFAFVKQLHTRDRIIPVTGDLSGTHALRAIGRDIARRGEQVSAFYVSNVEFYLMRQGSFAAFADNASSLPIGPRSVIIRSLFGGLYRMDHPQSVPGYFSTQLLQTMESFVAEHRAGGYRTYRDVVTKHGIELR